MLQFNLNTILKVYLLLSIKKANSNKREVLFNFNLLSFFWTFFEKTPQFTFKKPHYLLQLQVISNLNG